MTKLTLERSQRIYGKGRHDALKMQEKWDSIIVGFLDKHQLWSLFENYLNEHDSRTK